MSELKPPEEHAHLRWHWLRRERGLLSAAVCPFEWRDDQWHFGYSSFRPDYMANNEWAYSHPCHPAAITVDAGNEAQREVIADAVYEALGGLDEFHREDCIRIARVALTALAKLGAGT